MKNVKTLITEAKQHRVALDSVIKEINSRFDNKFSGEIFFHDAEYDGFVINYNGVSQCQGDAERYREALEFVLKAFEPCKADYIFSKRLALTKARSAIDAAIAEGKA